LSAIIHERFVFPRQSGCCCHQRWPKISNRLQIHTWSFEICMLYVALEYSRYFFRYWV